MIAESPAMPAWVQITIAGIGAIAAVSVALIGVMFKVNNARNNKQDSDHADNHDILVELQTGFIKLQNDFTQHLSDHVAQGRVQTESLELQKRSIEDTLTAADVLRQEVLHAADLVARATTTAADLLAAQHAPATHVSPA